MLLLLVAFSTAPATATAETPAPFWTGCIADTETDLLCSLPRGVATAPKTAPNRGNVFVGDSINRRVVEVDVWGRVVKAWGWDVVASGPGNTGTSFEICVPSDADVCKPGTTGSGAGQFGSPQGLALDSVGNIYVADRGLSGTFGNQRIQKFDPGGNFVLMWGKEVNETSGGDVCPRPGFPADACKAGGVGTEPGEFGELSVVGDYIEADTKDTATTLDDEVCVGEVEGIQCFDVDGVFVNQIELAGDGTVLALAIDTAGNRYASFCGASCSNGVPAKPNLVRKLNRAGEELATVAVPDPQGLATDSTNSLYALDGAANPTIRKYSSTGEEIFEEETVFPFFPTYPFLPGLNGSTGIATGDGCLTAPNYDLYVSNAASPPNSLIRAYGPPPDELHIEEFEQCKPPEVPPVIEDQGVIGVGVNHVVVQAQINPRFWADTSYHVQLATAACIGDEEDWEAGCVLEQPVPDALLGAGAVGSSAKTDQVLFSGLESETHYVFRFVAQSRLDAEGSEVNENGGPVFGEGGTEAGDGAVGAFTTRAAQQPGPTTGCSNDSFRSGAAAFLPDCRAYEMVSPVDKNGGDIGPSRIEENYVQVTADGNEITYTALPAFGGQPSNKFYNQYLAERGGSAWRNRGINAPLGRPLAGADFPKREISAFSADLCGQWFADYNHAPLDPDAPQGYTNLYRQDLCGIGGFQPMIHAAPLNGGAISYVGRDSVQGLSPDGVFLVAQAALTDEASILLNKSKNPNTQVYYLAGPGATPKVVSVLPTGVPDPGDVPPSTGSAGAEVGGGVSGRLGGNLEHAVSTDGSRVYWTSRVVQGIGRLYLREHPEQGIVSGECVQPSRACTIAVSSGAQAVFWTATPDGSAALFSEGPLVDSGPGSATLFRFDAASKTRIPVVEGLRGVLGASDDLARIYYISTENLTPGQENSNGDEAQEGAPNLYLDEEGTIAYVGTLADGVTGDVSAVGKNAVYSLGSPNPLYDTSRVTRDGSRIVFESRAPLTGFDNSDSASGEPALEVFTYEAGGDLSCVSCDPSGERPRARELRTSFQGLAFSPTVYAAAWIPGQEHPLYASRVLSEDGKRIFFNSNTPLVARDANGAQDVYEWEAPGAGSCEGINDPHYRDLNDGCVYLITSGKSPSESEFWDAGEDGRDVFFTTESSLLPQDSGNVDLYDARVNGGFPQPTEEEECEGEACAGPASPPQDGAPSSQTFVGPGNVIQAPGCGAVARRAAKLSKRAKRLRRVARRSSAPRRSRVFRRKARRFATKAKAKSRAAKRCRRARMGRSR